MMTREPATGASPNGTPENRVRRDGFAAVAMILIAFVLIGVVISQVV